MLKNNRLLKEVSLYISLVFYLNGYGSAALLVYTKNNITMFCLVESNPVKLETSYSVILPPMLSVLWHIQRFIKVLSHSLLQFASCLKEIIEWKRSANCKNAVQKRSAKTQCKNARANWSQIDDVYLYLANKQEFELLFMQKPIFYSHLVQEALPTSDYWLILSVTRCLYYLFNIRPFTTVKLTQWHALFVKID